MSYSIMTTCWNCTKKDNCTDHVKIKKAVEDINQDVLSSESGHMGSGSIVHQCSRMDAIDE